ncbi:Ig-like domain-containing protein [uncultured Deinococcus sp.]|uniref:Ig-like domain-containing protein n=1 Tax=uncultured Deinococcus sp. TaxID=158789 RepID=UPI0025FF196E|nr:Ig-like domain-containing protein [uncultured Deinococcus sp.]
MLKTVQPVKTYVVATLAALALAACNPPAPSNAVTKVTVNPSSVALVPQATQTFTVTVSGSGTFTKDVTWESSAPNVASVDPQSGVVTARVNGEATITATSVFDPSQSGTAAVTVAPPNTVTGVTVTPATATLKAGQTTALTATVQGTGTFAQTVTWKSSNTAAVTVSPSGVVTAVAPGGASITATSTVDPSKSGSAVITVPAPPSSGVMSVVNVNGGPFPGQLSFSRVDNKVDPTTGAVTPLPMPSPSEHNESRVRITNTGAESLQVSAAVTANFSVPYDAAPVTIAPGASKEITVRFIGQGSRIRTGTLTLTSNSTTTPTATFKLAGAWQSRYENNEEATTAQLIRDVLGFKTVLTTGGESINQKGSVRPQGDEVISPYWMRADVGSPVTVQQLAAYHTQGDTATLSWYPKGSKTTTGILTHANSDAQTILPRRSGSTSAATASFSPAATFGLKIQDEWSEPAYNVHTKDVNAGCVEPCGQHLRFYRAKDPSGAVMPNTYLLVMDYSGINYDYNDNIYLVRNIKPAPHLIDAGLASGATATALDGRVWTADQQPGMVKNTSGTVTSFTYKFFAPAEAYDEPNIGTSCAPADPVYRTYRGNTSKASPNSRVLTYNIPIENGTYNVTLRFIDMFSSTAGQRVFDVRSGATTLIPGLDIFARTGAACTPYDQTVSVPVTTGVMNLTFAASSDYPAIAGIEIQRP